LPFLATLYAIDNADIQLEQLAIPLFVIDDK